MDRNRAAASAVTVAPDVKPNRNFIKAKNYGVALAIGNN